MMIAYGYTIFTLLFIISSKYHIQQIPKSDVTRKWKKYEMINRIVIILLMFIAGGFKYWQDYFLSGSINILIFELGINIALKTESIFWIGSTSNLENFFGKYKWLGMILLVIISIIVKITI